MAAERRGQGPLNIDLPNPSAAPPISALFLIYFDIKAGYTIGWKRSLPGVELEGVVEYKSLPSGLHTVKEDLIYFVHDGHAGLSAYVNAPASEEDRNARMIAVGVMVPLSYGRLGRAWKHAEALKEMASECIIDPSNTRVLEEFWEEHKAQGPALPGDLDSIPDSPSSIKFKPIRMTQGKPKGHGRNRSASDGTALLPPGHSLSVYHPAWSLPRLLETFGPLIFPIHRAALLRKRILITAHAPVEETCNFVYDLSVLSNIPLAVTELLAPSAPPQRLRPLFSIGVHDIPFLEADLLAHQNPPDSTPESHDDRDPIGCGWIACTTDSILAMKSALYDVLITLPPPHSSSSTAERTWPKVESPQGVEMKATQRDLRRYKALRWGLSRHSPSISPSSTRDDQNQTIPRTTSSSQRDDRMLDLPDTDPIIEPLSWSALAYSGFMWWASAGEQRSTSEEEQDSDSLLLSNLSLSPRTPSTSTVQSQTQNQSSTSLASKTNLEAKQEMAIVAYFHRLTSQILTVLSDIIDSTASDSDTDSLDSNPDEHAILTSRLKNQDGEVEETGPEIYVSSADVARMGLDVWSTCDHAYVGEVAMVYFGRRASVEGGREVDVCGVRIC